MQDNKDIFSSSDNNAENQNEEFKTRIFDKNIEEIISNSSVDSYDDFYSGNDCEDNQHERSEQNMSRKKKRKNKNKKGMPTFVRILLILVISFLLAATIIFSAIDMLGITFNEDISADV